MSDAQQRFLIGIACLIAVRAVLAGLGYHPNFWQFLLIGAPIIIGLRLLTPRSDAAPGRNESADGV